MRQKWVMGNWKMNGRLQQVRELLQALLQGLPKKKACQTLVFPPAIFLPMTQQILEGSEVLYGAQNLYPQDSGAFTGELSPGMLQDYGCHYVLVGHSERRNLFHEDEKFVAEKFHQLKVHDMIPVLCVGESLAERLQGQTKEVISRQLSAIIREDTAVFQNCIIAYEPVWAIGTGQSASAEQAQDVHAFIRSFVADFDKKAAADLSLLYGGSVNEKNAAALFAMPDIDGALVGGASLNARQFVEIVKCIN